MSLSHAGLGRIGGVRAVALADAAPNRERGLGLQLLAGLAVGLAYILVAGASSTQVTMLAGLFGAGLAVIWPATGLTLLALILPMRETDALKPLYVDAVIVGATALGCVLRLPGDRRPVHLHPAAVVAVGYVVVSALSVIPAISGHPPEWAPSAALQVIRIGTAVGIFAVAVYLFRWLSPAPVLAVALLGATIAAALALGAYVDPGLVAPLDGVLSEAASAGRASGGFSNANYLGFFMTQASILAVGLWPATRRGHRPLLAIAIALVVAALVFSFSRNAYLGVIVGLTALTATRSPRAAVVLLIASVVAAVVLYPAFLEARVGGDVLDPDAIGQREQSENWRRLALGAGFSLFLTAPLFGVGFGVFHHLSPPYIGASPATYSHNAFVQVLAEQGLVGSIMVGVIGIALLVSLARTQTVLGRTALAMFIAYLVQSLFINSFTSLHISGLTWLTTAAAVSAMGRRPMGREGGT